MALAQRPPRPFFRKIMPPQTAWTMTHGRCIYTCYHRGVLAEKQGSAPWPAPRLFAIQPRAFGVRPSFNLN